MSKPEHIIQPNAHVAAMIVSSLTDNDLMTTSEQVNPRTELDSHANMFVAGKHAFVLARSGQTASVKAFSPDLAKLEIPIVDCALRYDCPYSNRSYILVVQHVLHVTSMDHNLLPPFLAREAGIEVSCTPKIHVKNPDITDHLMYFDAAQLRIPLSLWGVFSYFPTTQPSIADLESNALKVLRLTPDGPWDPHSDVYARNEENMLDWQGNIMEPSARPRILLETVAEDTAMIAALQISSIEARHIDRIHQN
jgi:hypothetical protein